MTTFDERESSFEAKFKHDKELQFRVNSRRNKLLGLWAANLLGIHGTEAESYAKEVVKSDFATPGDHDVLHKVLGVGAVDAEQVRGPQAQQLVAPGIHFELQLLVVLELGFEAALALVECGHRMLAP